MATVTVTDAADDVTDIPDIAIDPFGFIPDLSSAIAGLHGDDPTDPNYVFHTHYIDDLNGIVTMELAFTGLRSRKDRLVLNIHALDRSNDRLELAATTDVSLRTVAASGGRTSITFEAQPGRAYAVLGRTSVQPQASATELTIRCSQRRRTAENAAIAVPDARFRPSEMRAVAALAGSYSPTLASPMSQARTDAQFRERTFKDWRKKADLTRPATDAQWELAYLLQVLKVFGVLDARAHGLWFGAPQPDLVRLLHDADCTTVAAPAPVGRAPDAEGREDQAGGMDDGYFSLIGLPDPSELQSYDFLWSSGLCGLLHSTEDIIHLVEDSIEYLKPGGMAVHMLSADLRPDEVDAITGPVFTRNTLGRLALAAVAGKNEIAQLNMYADAHDGRPVPFGVIIRKG